MSNPLMSDERYSELRDNATRTPSRTNYHRDLLECLDVIAALRSELERVKAELATAIRAASQWETDFDEQREELLQARSCGDSHIDLYKESLERIAKLEAERDAALADARAANQAQEQHCADAVELARQLQAANQRADSLAAELEQCKELYSETKRVCMAKNEMQHDLSVKVEAAEKRADDAVERCAVIAEDYDYVAYCENTPTEKMVHTWGELIAIAIRATKESRDATT